MSNLDTTKVCKSESDLVPQYPSEIIGSSKPFIVGRAALFVEMAFLLAEKL